MYIEQPDKWETPEWVKYFLDFICSKDREDFKKLKGENNDTN